MYAQASGGRSASSFLSTALNVACSTFRDDATPSLFYKWPEKRSHTFCCGSSALLGNYSYPGRPRDPLVTGIYYDVSLVRSLKFYLAHWDLSFLDKTQPQSVTSCEYGLLHNFYRNWFYQHAILYGVPFGFTLIFVTQGFIVCMWIFWLRRPLALWSANPGTAITGCFHLGLLGVNGFATMVASAHGPLLSFASDAFSCAMALYSYLTLLSIMCMVFEHLAYEKDLLGHRLNVAVHKGLQRVDWRWQPVWIQIAAGTCIYMYCNTVETSAGQLDQAAGQAIPIIILAILWSAGFALVYMCHMLIVLLTEFLKRTGALGFLQGSRVFKRPESTSSSQIPGPASATSAPLQSMNSTHGPSCNSVASSNTSTGTNFTTNACTSPITEPPSISHRVPVLTPTHIQQQTATTVASSVSSTTNPIIAKPSLKRCRSASAIPTSTSTAHT